MCNIWALIETEATGNFALCARSAGSTCRPTATQRSQEISRGVTFASSLVSLHPTSSAQMPGPQFKAQMRDMEAPLLQQRQQLLENHRHQFHPKTVTRIVTRIQALALELLPIQVDLEEITSPTSSIITKECIEAFSQIAGDFDHCLPFALLQARRHFALQMRINPADSDENEGRRLACEALARKIIAKTPRQDQYSVLSARFTVIESDGDESLPLSGEQCSLDTFLRMTY